MRIKAVTGDGQYVTTKEFEKDTDELILWKQDLGVPLACMLKASPSNVIVGTRNGMVYSIDAGKGDILWEYDAGAPWSGGAIDGQSLFWNRSWEVHCLDKNTGRMTWKTHPDPAVCGASSDM